MHLGRDLPSEVGFEPDQRGVPHGRVRGDGLPRRGGLRRVPSGVGLVWGIRDGVGLPRRGGLRWMPSGVGLVWRIRDGVRLPSEVGLDAGGLPR